MSTLRSRRGALVVVAVAICAFSSSAVPAPASDGPPGAPRSNPAFAIPLAGSVTTATTAWATVAMGRKNGDFDLFWQLFALDGTTNRLRLVTPPGVADNGGLVVAPDPDGTATLVGFGASQELTFSPLALSGDAGRSWTPGGLPDALVGAPSVIGFRAGGQALALVSGSSPQVLVRSGTLTSWKTLETRSALAKTPAGKTCAIGSLEAVAYERGGTPMVGASCREPSTPGIFVDSDRQWHLADVPVPGALASDVFATLRLDGDSALLAALHGQRTSLVAAWEPVAGRPWVISPPLPVGSSDDLLASGGGPGTTQFAVVREGGTIRAELIGGPGQSWHALPALPTGTATITIAPDGEVDSLVVADTRLSLWRLSDGALPWTKVQTIAVPIVFGSSS